MMKSISSQIKQVLISGLCLITLPLVGCNLSSDNIYKERIGWEEDFILNDDVECVKIWTYKLNSDGQPLSGILTNTIYNFNKNGDVESVIIEDHKGNIQGKTKYQYDDKQRLICELYYSDRYSSPSEKRYEYYGNVRYHREGDMGVITSFDSDGRILSKMWIGSWGCIEPTEYNYNDKGQLISVTSFEDTGYRDDRTLDTDGKILKQTAGYIDCAVDITYIYDSKGILVRKDIIGGGAYEGESYIQYQEYDTHNNPQIIKDTNMSRYKIIEYTYRSR